MIRKTLLSSCLLIIATAAATDALYYGESPHFHQFSSILQSNNLILCFLAKEVNHIYGNFLLIYPSLLSILRKLQPTQDCQVDPFSKLTHLVAEKLLQLAFLVLHLQHKTNYILLKKSATKGKRGTKAENSSCGLSAPDNLTALAYNPHVPIECCI